ncbi:hypothetical protein Glove_60g116 [Diversispora epigaea]|uniref:Uncharacterized protein n=1 Tax=Diversispora epigaea TaxID=1348612 RepID=A0A397JBR3_9GLOM|nr:hypothetical protein Glove_60g116 [Diversispora epigaea]
MFQLKTNEREWKTRMDDLKIENAIRNENIPFYKYSEFHKVKLITVNIFKATYEISQKTVALKNIYLYDDNKFALDNLINDYGIGTVVDVDYQMALKFFNLAVNETISYSSNSSSGRKLYNINKEICTISLAHIEEKAFELHSKSADKGNIIAQTNVGVCYDLGITKDEDKVFQCYIKSALAGNIDAIFSVGA